MARTKQPAQLMPEGMTAADLIAQGLRVTFYNVPRGKWARFQMMTSDGMQTFERGTVITPTHIVPCIRLAGNEQAFVIQSN